MKTDIKESLSKTYITDGLFKNIKQRSYVWGQNSKKINNSHEMQNELNDKYRKGVNRRETIRMCHTNARQEVGEIKQNDSALILNSLV